MWADFWKARKQSQYKNTFAQAVEQALELALEDEFMQAAILIPILEGQAVANDFAGAQKTMDRLLELGQTVADAPRQPIILLSVARASSMFGRKAEARSLVDQILSVNAPISGDLPPESLLILGGIAQVLADMGDKQTAAALLDNVLEDFDVTSVDNENRRDEVLALLLTVRAEMQDFPDAISTLDEALVFAEMIDPRESTQADTIILIAEAYAKMGAVSEARTALSRAIGLARGLPDLGSQAVLFMSIAKVQNILGDKAKTNASLSYASERVLRIVEKPERTTALALLAQAYVDVGRAKKAHAVIYSAIRVASKIRDKEEKAIALANVTRSMAKVAKELSFPLI